VENKEAKFTQRVIKMKLAKDKQSLYRHTTPSPSPKFRPRRFEYRLAPAPRSNGSSINTK